MTALGGKRISLPRQFKTLRTQTVPRPLPPRPCPGDAAKSRFTCVSVTPSRSAISSTEMSDRSFRKSSTVHTSDGESRSKKTQGRLRKACPS